MLKKKNDYQIVGKASNAEELYQQLDQNAPDILIMEIDMPQINGINSLRTIKENYPNTRVLIYSVHPEEI